MFKQLSVIFLVLYTFSTSILAETTQKTPLPPESIIASDSMAKMITGLLLVLAIIIASTWLLKRFSIIPTISSDNLKVIAATGVGQRERVVIVEIGETWLVLGVAPGQVTKLHTMEKSSIETADKTLKHTATEFSDKLDTSIQKSNNR